MRARDGPRSTLHRASFFLRAASNASRAISGPLAGGGSSARKTAWMVYPEYSRAGSPSAVGATSGRIGWAGAPPSNALALALAVVVGTLAKGAGIALA